MTTRRHLAFGMAVLVLLLGCSRYDTQLTDQVVGPVLAALGADRIAKVAILHVSEDIHVPMPITPQDLNRYGEQRFLDTLQARRSLSVALREARVSPVASDEILDLRWGVVLLSSNGQRMHEIYLSHSGLCIPELALVDGRPLRSNSALRDWFEATWGHFEATWGHHGRSSE